MMIPEASVPDVPDDSPLSRPLLQSPELADPVKRMSERTSRRVQAVTQSIAQPAVRVTADLCRCGVALILSLGGYDDADL